MKPLNVVTYNVRRFAHGKERHDTVDLVVRRLLELSPISLLALNEVDVALRPHALPRLQEALGLEHCAFFGHAGPSQNYGNAILSRAPFVPNSVIQTHLDGGTTVLDREGRQHRIVRGMQSVRTTLGGVPAVVATTHLDHMVEAERVTQMRHVLRCLASDAAASHTLLLGDMNALRRTDYTDAEWEQHEAHNAANGWQPPSDSERPEHSLGLLLGAGFRDCAREALTTHSPPGGGNAVVRWQSPPWSAHVHREGAPRYRIDYIFSRHPSESRGSGGGGAADGGSDGRSTPTAPRLECVGVQTHNTTDDGGVSSDHCPVAAQFVVVEP